MISKKWEFISCSSEAIQSLSQQCSISPFLARLLLNRGISEPHDAETFLHGSLKNLPDPFLLKDMDKAVSRLVSAIRNHEKIVVYGDYDVDGTTATSMLLLFFEELGCPVEFYIPHRMREGYSLNGAALEELKKRKTSVVVTVDNGISALKEAGLAKELGLDLIITDHHLVAEKMPDAYAVVNPQRPDCPYPAKEISGAGVAFNLIMALRQRLREEGYFGQNQNPT